ncbi:hypothetical protein LI138_10785, partial [Phocaeicola dorei]|uniref:hypothetical protein n=1 Tax=Phocaeicola dorei TaxID=357276 RepID=UPI001D07274D
RSSLLYINSKIFVRSEDRGLNYEPIFDCLPSDGLMSLKIINTLWEQEFILRQFIQMKSYIQRLNETTWRPMFQLMHIPTIHYHFTGLLTFVQSFTLYKPIQMRVKLPCCQCLHIITNIN